jgi:tRNA-dihydrouridine synthase 3
MSFADILAGAVVLGPMTKGCNLPYRRLCTEFGARVTMSEMALARRLKQKRRPEYALIRRAPDEHCFGVQLAGTAPEEMAWAAALVESRGADFVDVNLGCPIDYFTSKGLGAALARQPRRVARIVQAMKAVVSRAAVTVKIRLGWNDQNRNYLEVARAAVEAGADAVFVHGRTRDARYRFAADWDAIGEVARAVPVPVVGNGDLLFPHEIEQARRRSACAGVMVARGALIKPWIFREAVSGYTDVTGDDRLGVYRRYVALALEHWGDDEHGRARAGEFLRWHLGPVRAAPPGRLLAGDAGARVGGVRAHAPRGAARPPGRGSTRLAGGAAAGRRFHRPGSGSGPGRGGRTRDRTGGRVGRESEITPAW